MTFVHNTQTQTNKQTNTHTKTPVINIDKKMTAGTPLINIFGSTVPLAFEPKKLTTIRAMTANENPGEELDSSEKNGSLSPTFDDRRKQ
jgi:hypothetical protein